MPSIREVAAYGSSQQYRNAGAFESWSLLPAKTIYIFKRAKGVSFFVYGPRHEYVAAQLRIPVSQMYQYALLHGIAVIDGAPTTERT